MGFAGIMLSGDSCRTADYMGNSFIIFVTASGRCFAGSIGSFLDCTRDRHQR